MAAETALDLSAKQRKRTVWRLDGGAGSEEEIRWLLERDYHILAKGLNNRRSHALARQIQRWDPYRDILLGEIPSPAGYPRPVRIFIIRRQEKGQLHHNYYVTTLKLPSKKRFLAAYEARGGAEVEQFRGDKQGLGLSARRKRSLLGQKAYILLTDLAHNLLADFYHQALVGTRFECYGIKRIVRDLLATQGLLTFNDHQLQKVDLLSQTQFSADLLFCLQKYCSTELK